MNKWLAQLKKQTAIIPNALLPKNDPWISLHQAVQAATSEEQLERLHDQLTAAWNKGEVDQEAAEDLTRIMWERSRHLYRTEHHADEQPANNAPVSKVDIPIATAFQGDNRVYLSDMLSISNDTEEGRT
jgi:hypothetical protein